MAKRLEKNIDYLSVLSKCKPRQRRVILQTADDELIKAICDCVENILDGKVPLNPKQKKQLAKYRQKLRKLRASKACLRTKRRYIVQNGGFLPALLAPLLSVIGGLVSSLVS